MKRSPPGEFPGGKPPFMGICMCMFMLFRALMFGLWPSRPWLTGSKRIRVNNKEQQPNANACYQG